MVPYMKDQGAKVGIKFSYGGKVGNTLDSHRLVELAKTKGKTVPLKWQSLAGS